MCFDRKLLSLSRIKFSNILVLSERLSGIRQLILKQKDLINLKVNMAKKEREAERFWYETETERILLEADKLLEFVQQKFAQLRGKT